MFFMLKYIICQVRAVTLKFLFTVTEITSRFLKLKMPMKSLIVSIQNMHRKKAGRICMKVLTVVQLMIRL